MDPFENFPNEMIEKICMDMTPSELSKFRRTSKRINEVCFGAAKIKEEELLAPYGSDPTLRLVVKELKRRSELVLNENVYKVIGSRYIIGVSDVDFTVLIRGNFERAVLELQKIINKSDKWPPYLNKNIIEAALLNLGQSYDVTKVPIEDLVDDLESELTNPDNHVYLEEANFWII